MLTFRLVQCASTVTVFGYWVLRALMNPFHLHPTMLVAAGLMLVVSEVSYRAGLSARDEKQLQRNR